MKILMAATLLVAMGASTALADSPDNDDFVDATVIPDLPFSDEVDTRDATTAAEDPDCFGKGPTVWYAFTPLDETEVAANTFGSDYDTTLSVYTGTLGALDQLVCNDDAGQSLQSFVRFDATAGETYFFMVGAFGSGPGGTLEFSVDVAPPPLVINLRVNRFGRFVPLTGEAVISGTLTCSEPASAFVDIELRQEVGRRFVILAFGPAVIAECEGKTAWSATVTSETGLFGGGPAKVTAFASAGDVETGESAFAEASASLRLRGGGK